MVAGYVLALLVGFILGALLEHYRLGRTNQ